MHTVLASTDTEIQITAFKTRFTELQARTKEELVSLKKSVKVVNAKLLARLPSRIEKDYQRYVHVKRRRAQHTLEELFEDLSEYCQNFFEYELLQYIISSTNCRASLKNAMEQYSKDVQHFREYTTASNFIQFGQQVLKKSIPKGYRKLTTKHIVNPAEYTMAKIDSFKEDVWRHPNSKLSECAFHMCSIRESSVQVEWAFPEEFGYSLIAFFCSEDGKELLQEHQVNVTFIDDTLINQSVKL